MALQALLIALILTNLKVLGTSRIPACIRAVALQGVLLGGLPLLAHAPGAGLILVALTSMILKGAVFPWLLFLALREARVRREVEPFVGYNLSFLFGLVALAFSLALARRLSLPVPLASPLLLPVAFSTMLVGIFVIVSRRKALTQVLGYLIFENGIYAFGVAVVPEAPLVIELGVLLDAFVAVFVMGIAIFHINREFDSIDTRKLSALKD
jgi:hydrogenase-4 component E